MYQFILLIHVFAAICIIALVLVQQGKGASLGPTYGSGASQTVFGSRGSGSFLYRITLSLLLVFFITSISLNYLVSANLKKPTTFMITPPVKTNVEKANAKQPEKIPAIPTRK